MNTKAQKQLSRLSFLSDLFKSTSNPTGTFLNAPELPNNTFKHVG